MTDNFSRERSRITSRRRPLPVVARLDHGYRSAARHRDRRSHGPHIATLERRSATTDAELRRLSGQIRMAQEQERRYLSRELHDQAGQMLTGLRMELASISHDAGEEEFSARVAHAKGIVEQTLRVVRNIAMMLRPSMLDDLGLASAIGWLVREVKRSSGIEIQSEVDPVAGFAAGRRMHLRLSGGAGSADERGAAFRRAPDRDRARASGRRNHRKRRPTTDRASTPQR